MRIPKILLAFACVVVTSVPLVAKTPNVVLIITDDQSWDSLGNPEVAARMKKTLATALRSFENRPFGEFTD